MFNYLLHLFKGSVFSLLPACKLLVVIALSFLTESESDDFGRYSLAYGLSSVFAVLAALEGRVFILRSEKTKTEFDIFIFLQLSIALICLLLLMGVQWSAHDYLLILFIYFTRISTNTLSSCLSMYHRLSGKSLAYRDISVVSVVILVLFFINIVLFDLLTAVVCDFLITGLSTFFMYFRLQFAYEIECEFNLNSKIDLGNNILKESLFMSFVSALNSAVPWLLLFIFNSIQKDTASAMTMAKIIALQAIWARVVSSQGLYMSEFVLRVYRDYKKYSSIFLFSFFLSFLFVQRIIDTDSVGFFTLSLLIFSIINTISILCLQQFYLATKEIFLFKIFLVEILIIIMFSLFFKLTLVSAVSLLILTRIFRILFITRVDL